MLLTGRACSAVSSPPLMESKWSLYNCQLHSSPIKLLHCYTTPPHRGHCWIITGQSGNCEKESGTFQALNTGFFHLCFLKHLQTTAQNVGRGSPVKIYLNTSDMLHALFLLTIYSENASVSGVISVKCNSLQTMRWVCIPFHSSRKRTSLSWTCRWLTQRKLVSVPTW